MILIVTSKRDSHVGAVTKHLDAAARPWVRVNVEDLATNTEITIQPALGSGNLSMRDSGKVLDLDAVTAVWYRKPDPVALGHFQIDEAARDYVEAEFNEVIHGIYALLGRAKWINNPLYARVAHRKLLQLRVAHEVGFKVPETIVTNNLEYAVEFSKMQNGDLAIKSLGAISVIHETDNQVVQYGVFTRRITEKELLAQGEKVRHMPTMFQQFVEKQAELRITCVGREVFACKISPRDGDVTSDDHRFDTANLPHEAVNIPELVDRMHTYMDRFGLNFGCFDFIVPKCGGEPIFLEMNPNGQWHWVQQLTGQDIGSAVARLLG
jgi:hypothetical protein